MFNFYKYVYRFENGDTDIHICKICNKEFKTYHQLGGHVTSHIKKECPICKKKFNLYGFKNHVETHNREINCLECCVLTLNKRFCSSSCSAKFYNKKRKKNTKYCLYCNKEISKNAEKYCNLTCKKHYEYNKFIEEWKKGKHNYSENGNMSLYIKRYVRKKFNNKCCVCGWNKIHPITENVPVQINHIDGDHKNNKEQNLELLCPNCHNLTENFGSLNPKGRNERRKRRLKKYSDDELKCIICGDEIFLYSNKKLCKNCYNKLIANEKKCLDCGCNIDLNAKRCVDCNGKTQRKVERPSYDQLKKELKETSYLAVGRKYKVSGTSIKKWIKQYENSINVSEV